MDNLIRKGELFIASVGLWVIFGLIHHLIIMSVYNTQIFHCLLLSMIFGIITFFLIYNFYTKFLELQSKNKILEYNMDLDLLTGLLNRFAFEKHILGISKGEQHSIIFADIDNFKNFNDNFGHAAGDVVLHKVSEIIKGSVRSSDKVYRYGGEEIVVVLSGCDKNHAIAIAEKIRTNVMKIDNTPFPNITISLGVSTYPEDNDDISQIIKTSDYALLHAKKNGKNRIDVFGKINF